MKYCPKSARHPAGLPYLFYESKTKMKKTLIAALLNAALLTAATASAAEGDEQRHGVPGGFKPAPDSVKSAVLPQLEKLEARVAALKARPDLAEFVPDAEIYVKAVRFAIDREEFFGGGDGESCTKALASADTRLAELESGKHSFYSQKGNTLVAYRSYIDSSVQPFFIDVPKGYTGSKPVPLTVWLHGRGDQDTDIHFIRGGGRGPINVPDSIGIAVFGRNCLGFKAAGEVDVLEAIASAKKRFNIDPDRVVLGGFSMGGAGSWTVGGHYTDQFCGVQPGAGYAETAKYQKIPQAKYPVWYEQKLWGVNDMPGYARNLFNTMTVGYGGENDAQKQAGELMAQTFKNEGREMKLIVGKGAGHGHTKEALKEINALMAEAAKKGRDWYAKEVTLQTPTLRYNRMKWVEATLLKRHWEDSRIDAKIEDAAHITITTKNIAAFKITKPFENDKNDREIEITIDGQVQTVKLSDIQSGTAEFVLMNNQWRVGGPSKDALAKDVLAKVHGLTGPIDDAFMDSFLVVIPSGKCASPAVQKWVDSELAHARARWQDCFRAVLPTRIDTEIAPTISQNLTSSASAMKAPTPSSSRPRRNYRCAPRTLRSVSVKKLSPPRRTFRF